MSGIGGIKSGYDKYTCTRVRTVLIFATTVLILVTAVLIFATTVLMNMMTNLIVKWVFIFF